MLSFHFHQGSRRMTLSAQASTLAALHRYTTRHSTRRRVFAVSLLSSDQHLPVRIPQGASWCKSCLMPCVLRCAPLSPFFNCRRFIVGALWGCGKNRRPGHVVLPRSSANGCFLAVAEVFWRSTAALKHTPRLAGIWMVSPIAGFLPLRVARSRGRNSAGCQEAAMEDANRVDEGQILGGLTCLRRSLRHQMADRLGVRFFRFLGRPPSICAQSLTLI